MCVREGMSYYEVANAIGVEGEPTGASGSVEVYGWNGVWTGGYAIIEGYYVSYISQWDIGF
jgi:hypothetical protein